MDVEDLLNKSELCCCRELKADNCRDDMKHVRSNNISVCSFTAVSCLSAEEFTDQQLRASKLWWFEAEIYFQSKFIDLK